jgi:hypothetical protein
MVCTLGSKPQDHCERRGQRRRPTSRYWFPAIGRQLQRVGCTPSTGANLVLWHTRILFHAICTFVFPRMIARCRVTRPPQANSHCDLFSLGLGFGDRQGLRTPRPAVLLLSISSPLPTTTTTRPRRIRNTLCDGIPPTTNTATSAARRKKNIPRPFCMHLGALYPAFLSQSLSYLVVTATINNLPLMYEYHEARHTTLPTVTRHTPPPGFNHPFFQGHNNIADSLSSII